MKETRVLKFEQITPERRKQPWARDIASLRAAIDQAHRAMAPLHDEGMDGDILMLGFILAVDQACGGIYGVPLQHPDAQAKIQAAREELNAGLLAAESGS